MISIAGYEYLFQSLRIGKPPKRVVGITMRQTTVFVVIVGSGFVEIHHERVADKTGILTALCRYLCLRKLISTSESYEHMLVHQFHHSVEFSFPLRCILIIISLLRATQPT